MRSKIDQYWIGIGLGLLLPILFIAVYAHQYHLEAALRSLHWHGAIMTQMLVLSVFPNAALLFVLYTLELWRMARGMMIAIFPYLIAALWVAV